MPLRTSSLPRPSLPPKPGKPIKPLRSSSNSSLPPMLGGTSAPTSLLSPRIGALLIELVSGMYTVKEVLDRYGLSTDQFRRLLADPAFKRAYKEQKAAFHSAANTPARIKLKAQLATEALLEDMFRLAANRSEPASARVAAFGQINKLTGLEHPEPDRPRNKFSLVINLPKNPTDPATLSSAVSSPPDPDGSANTLVIELQTDADGNPVAPDQMVAPEEPDALGEYDPDAADGYAGDEEGTDGYGPDDQTGDDQTELDQTGEYQTEEDQPEPLDLPRGKAGVPGTVVKAQRTYRWSDFNTSILRIKGVPGVEDTV